MEKKKYKLDYYTDMYECYGGNVGGTICIELTEEETACLQLFIDKARNEQNCNLNLLPEQLGNMLAEEIYYDVDYEMASNALYAIGYCDLFDPPFSEEEWDMMERNQQIKYLMGTASRETSFVYNN